MDRAVVWFIRMSLFYFLLASVLGMGMVSSSAWVAYYRPLHVHFNLLGWMSMMIFGVGYHILPKFSGKYIYSTKIMNAQFWVSNAGLLGMGLGWSMMGRGFSPDAGRSLLLASSVASLAGAGMFVFNMAMTIQEVKKPG